MSLLSDQAADTMQNTPSFSNLLEIHFFKESKLKKSRRKVLTIALRGDRGRIFLENGGKRKKDGSRVIFLDRIRVTRHLLESGP
jgi:hypothetical protein